MKMQSRKWKLSINSTLKLFKLLLCAIYNCCSAVTKVWQTICSEWCSVFKLNIACFASSPTFHSSDNRCQFYTPIGGGGDVGDTIHTAVSPLGGNINRVDKRQTEEHFSRSYHPSNTGPSLERTEVSLRQKYRISSAHPANEMQPPTTENCHVIDREPSCLRDLIAWVSIVTKSAASVTFNQLYHVIPITYVSFT